MINIYLQSDFKREGLQSKGKQPRLFNKDLNFNLSEKNIKNDDNHKVGLEAAIFLRKRNSSLIEFFSSKMYRGLKLTIRIGNFFKRQQNILYIYEEYL